MEQMRQFPAVVRLKEYAATITVPDLSGFPEPIVEGWEKFSSLVTSGQVTGARMALKDLYEITLKTVVLTAANEIYLDCDRRTADRNRFLQILFVKNPAFGYWKQEIGGGLLRVLKKEREPGQMPMIAEQILTNLLKLMEKHQIVAWRNQDAHGAAHDLQDTSAVQELIDKWLALEQHFAQQKEAYRGLPFVKTEMYPFVIYEDEQWFFFDSFLYEKEKIVFLNYRNNRRMMAAIDGVETFYERFQMQPVGEERDSFVDSDELTDWEMDQLKRERRLKRLKRPDYLVAWLKEQLSFQNGGYLLLQMERGMGKTTFAHMLDPSGETGVRLGLKEDTTIRCYSITPFYNRQSVVSFARELEYQFSHEYRNGQQERIVGGSNEGRIADTEDVSDLRESLAAFLNRMRRQHEKQFGREKLLLVLDGADEVMTESKQSGGFLQVTDILPDPTLLDEGVFILLLSRTDRETAPYQVWTRVRDGWSNPYLPNETKVFVVTDQEYRKVVLDYMQELALGALSADEVAAFLQNGSWNFVFAAAAAELIRLYGMREKEELRTFLCSIQGLEDLFERYMEHLRFIYGTGYFEELRDVLLRLAAVPIGKTLTELAKQRQEGGITYRLAGMVQDLFPFIKEVRDGKESRYACANLLVRDLILKRYNVELSKLSEDMLQLWLQDPTIIPDREYLMRAPFSADLFMKSGLALMKEAEDRENLESLPLLQIVEMRIQESGCQKSPFGPYLLRRQLERAVVDAKQATSLVKQIQDAPKEYQNSLLTGFWWAYDECLAQRFDRVMKREENATLTEEETMKQFFWNEKDSFAQIWNEIAPVFYPKTCLETIRRWETLEVEDIISLYHRSADTVYENLIRLKQQLSEMRCTCASIMLGIHAETVKEKLLLYFCLTIGYRGICARKEETDEDTYISPEAYANELILDLWDWYSVPGRSVDVWRDCLCWSVPSWMRLRLPDLDTDGYAEWLANQTGLPMNKFLDRCHAALLKNSDLTAAYIQQPAKEWFSNGTRILEKLKQSVREDQESLWTYLRIEQDFLQKINKKYADHLMALQLGEALYTLHEKREYEHFLRAYGILLELLPKQNWLQKRNLEKKLKLKKNLPVMVSNMAFLLATEGNETSYRSIEDLIYRNQVWFGLSEEVTLSVIDKYCSEKNREWYRGVAKRALVRTKETLGKRIYQRPKEEALYVALNRASFFELWKKQENPVAKYWYTGFEACADDAEETLTMLEHVVEIPAALSEWESQLHAEMSAWKDPQHTSMSDEVLCHAVVFRRKIDTWGREAMCRIWENYLNARLRVVSTWHLSHKGKYVVKKWKRLVTLKMEAVSMRGANRQEQLMVLQDLCRDLLYMMRGALNGYQAPEFLESFSVLGDYVGDHQAFLQAETMWEPQLMFVLTWYRYLISDEQDRLLLREDLLRLLTKKEAFLQLDMPFLQHMLENVLEDWVGSETDQRQTYRGWIQGMAGVLVRDGNYHVMRRKLRDLISRYIRIGSASLYTKLSRSYRKEMVQEETQQKSTWEQLKSQVNWWKEVSELFREALETEVRLHGYEKIWSDHMEWDDSKILSYGGALNFINGIEGPTKTWHVDKAVNDLRRAAAYLNDKGEVDQAKKLYEGILLICQSCEEDFMTEDYPPYREVEAYFFEKPWRVYFKHCLVGYCIAAVEYLTLLENGQDTDKEKRIQEVGDRVLKHIRRIRENVPEHRREYYRDVAFVWELIAEKVAPLQK